MNKSLVKLAKKTIHKFGFDVVKYHDTSTASLISDGFERDDIEIISRVKPFTHTSPERIHAVCNSVKYIVANQIPGDIVECGVWKGGSMMAAMLTLLSLKDTSRNIYLFDTFEGMTEPDARDVSFLGKEALDLFKGIESSNQKWLYSSVEEVKEAVYSTGYDKDKIHFVKGKVEDTLPEFAPAQISLLRLDTDWYESTRHELIHLFPCLVPGGVLIIDDYGHWQGAKQATDEYIQQNNLKILLNRIDYTGRIGVKI
ncbi:TylF/MycF/NovP-related O-methyltransferase [Merismopedia glauca]|uniref:Macrocin O-methyltransferase n=1 Tax=Merismopedia glauca CCAP 1448/3 TaxID=1296344 RepID=A0A2T1C784_9CYAN|nr:TylF/MycF/NovP-related O-methyltransferase [Merismopedia glauca]PSB04096.1 macrocin O-methyltransferase [Merismopedia glauca CCAP 1448/3]